MQGSQTEKVSQTSHLFALLFTSFLPQIFPLFSCRGYFFVYSSLLQNSQKLMLLGFLEGFFFWFLFKFVKRKRLTENVCFVLYFSAFGFSISFKLRTFETICQGKKGQEMSARPNTTICNMHTYSRNSRNASPATSLS